MELLRKVWGKTAIFCMLGMQIVSVEAQVLPDQFEPDDNTSSAKPIQFGVPQIRTLHDLGYSAADQDLIELFLPEPGYIHVTIEGDLWLRGLSLDIGLHSGGMGLLGTSVVSSFPTGGRTFSTGRALRAGIYYIYIRGSSNSSIHRPSIGEYTLTASYTPGELEYQNNRADEHEDDDSIYYANRLANGEIRQHTIHHNEDMDWFVFRLGGCAQILAENAAYISNGKFVMQLWSQGFREIDRIDSKYTYRDVASSHLLNKLGSGLYFLSVTHIENGIHPLTADPYVLRVTAFQCEDNSAALPGIIDLLLSD